MSSDIKKKYEDIDGEDRQWLDDEVKELNTLVEKTVANHLEIGKRLKGIQDRLANYSGGTFVRWIEDQCMWSKSTVYRHIAIYERFGESSSFPTVGNLSIDVKALSLLSSKAIPDEAMKEVVEEVINRAEKEQITYKIAREIVKPHKPDTSKAKQEESKPTDDWINIVHQQIQDATAAAETLDEESFKQLQEASKFLQDVIEAYEDSHGEDS